MPHSTNAPRRALIPLVRPALRVLQAAIYKLKDILTDKRQFYPDLSDSMAHDIGMSPVDLEVRRLRLPSRYTHHPYG
ncbi:hypothetical protein NBRC116594_29100 [Shimia sp. NS0008-38b]|uniref:hypothetical protein n=1 Tax=Shimia sp. NS0008-38b TaxID=3127653 RepID=UPI003104C20A